MYEAQWSVQLQERQSPGRSCLREPEDLSRQGRERQDVGRHRLTERLETSSMDRDRPGMVIVGAGECGARAALTLREQGYPGSVTLIGAEWRHPYERPPLSK